MSVEAATFINDLQPINPPSNDPRSQGDDHLRLIKQVLQNTFPSLTRAIYFDNVVSKSSNFSVVAADMNKLHLVNTGAGVVTATLPSGLAAGDAGWTCRFMKTTTDANPIFIAPFSGTLSSGAIAGLSTARRCIPGIEFRALWTGSAWIVTRCLALPIGSLIDFNSATLPAGYEWPNGQSLSSAANYPEYNSANGGLTTLDLRGRVAVTLDNLGGSAAGRLAGGIITGAAIGNTGGTDTVTLNVTQIASHTHNNTFNDASHFHSLLNFNAGSGGNNAPVASNGGSIGTTTNTANSNTGASMTNVAAGGGSSHSNLQPSIMCAKILIVE